MAEEKPLPMQIGDSLLYTLTSYDPVEIEVNVPYTSDADVEFTLKSLVARAGGELDSVNDEWVKENFPGAENLDDMRAQLRKELEQVNASYAENSKGQLCAEALAKRLEQSIPAQVVASYRTALVEQFETDIAQDGLSKEDVVGQGGDAALEAMFDSQALEMTQQLAALDAYVNQKKLSVNDEEVPGLLQLPPDQAEQVVEQAKTDGAFDSLKKTALRNKAMRSLVAEASCTYKHETPEEAEKRVEEYRRLEQAERLQKELAEDAKKPEEGATE